MLNGKLWLTISLLEEKRYTVGRKYERRLSLFTSGDSNNACCNLCCSVRMVGNFAGVCDTNIKKITPSHF